MASILQTLKTVLWGWNNFLCYYYPTGFTQWGQPSFPSVSSNWVKCCLIGKHLVRRWCHFPGWADVLCWPSASCVLSWTNLARALITKNVRWFTLTILAFHQGRKQRLVPRGGNSCHQNCTCQTLYCCRCTDLKSGYSEALEDKITDLKLMTCCLSLIESHIPMLQYLLSVAHTYTTITWQESMI